MGSGIRTYCPKCGRRLDSLKNCSCGWSQERDIFKNKGLNDFEQLNKLGEKSK